MHYINKSALQLFDYKSIITAVPPDSTVTKILLAIDLCPILLTYNKCVSHVFEESEGCGHEKSGPYFLSALVNLLNVR